MQQIYKSVYYCPLTRSCLQRDFGWQDEIELQWSAKWHESMRTVNNATIQQL